jgi:DNA modification methylase
VSFSILEGHALTRLRELPDGIVNCVVTSPPYYGLRDYKTSDESWGDGWNGELGQEPTPDQYVSHLVDIFREVRRVLHETGTLWLNIGDSRANDSKWGGKTSGRHAEELHDDGVGRMRRQTGLQPRELIGIPWMLAFALRADGWHVRSDNVWAKGVSFVPNYSGSCMPESVDDRTTQSHEYVFMLTKSDRYFCDMFAVRERGIIPAGTRAAKGSGTREGNRRGSSYATYDGYRNLRSVWAIGGEQFDGEFCGACGRFYNRTTSALLRVDGRATCECGESGRWVSHFATFPMDLVRPCIMAGTSEVGRCSACRSPRERITQVDEFEGVRARRHIGWRPMCECTSAEIEPCLVMDPFSGSATVGLVALRLQRDYLGIELNPDYARLGRKRALLDAPLFNAAIERIKEANKNGELL